MRFKVAAQIFEQNAKFEFFVQSKVGKINSSGGLSGLQGAFFAPSPPPMYKHNSPFPSSLSSSMIIQKKMMQHPFSIRQSSFAIRIDRREVLTFPAGHCGHRECAVYRRMWEAVHVTDRHLASSHDRRISVAHRAHVRAHLRPRWNAQDRL